MIIFLINICIGFITIRLVIIFLRGASCRYYQSFTIHAKMDKQSAVIGLMTKE